MDSNELVKVVFFDDGEEKTLKGYIVYEDGYEIKLKTPFSEEPQRIFKRIINRIYTVGDSK